MSSFPTYHSPKHRAVIEKMNILQVIDLSLKTPQVASSKNTIRPQTSKNHAQITSTSEAKLEYNTSTIEPKQHINTNGAFWRRKPFSALSTISIIGQALTRLAQQRASFRFLYKGLAKHKHAHVHPAFFVFFLHRVTEEE